MKKIIFICIMSFSFSGISIAAPEKAVVIEMLQGRHWNLDDQTFKKLGEGTESILIEIADDTTLINFLRFRALEALTLFPTDEVATFLEETSETPFAPFARRGFEALSRGFSKLKPEIVQKAAQRLLNHKNVSVKISAARSLKALNQPAFQKFISKEPEAWIRKAAQE